MRGVYCKPCLQPISCCISGHSFGFTAIEPLTTPGYALKFSKVLINTGNGYNSTSGIVSCRFPGIYLFSATIVGNPGSSRGDISCEIQINGVVQLKAQANGVNWYLSGSIDLIVYLNIGDEIHLGSCFGHQNIHHFTSFSGALIHPD